MGGNQLEDLAGPWVEIPNLTSVNLSEECGTGDIKKNPVATGAEQLRLEMLICHWRLDIIDGKDVKDEERTSAQALNEQRMEEEARKAAEASEGGDDADS